MNDVAPAITIPIQGLRIHNDGFRIWGGRWQLRGSVGISAMVFGYGFLAEGMTPNQLCSERLKVVSNADERCRAIHVFTQYEYDDLPNKW